MPNNHLRQSGFTLIEILVVIVIIAIIATAAVLQLGILDSPRTAKLAVNLLRNTLPAIQTRAVLQPSVLGIFYSGEGYTVKRLWIDKAENSVDWHRIADDRLSNPNAWPDVVSVSWQPDAIAHAANNDKDDMNFDSDSDSNNSDKTAAALTIYPNGLVSPGTLTVSWKGKIMQELHISAAGMIKDSGDS